MGIVEAVIAIASAIVAAIVLWLRGDYHKRQAETERQRADNATSTIRRREELDKSLDDLADQHRKEIDDEQEHLATGRRDHFE